MMSAIMNQRFAALVGAIVVLLACGNAAAESPAGTYRGFLAFDHKGKEVREALMVSFHADGTMIMGAEEGHDEPVDPETGLATRNDVESANLGVWRESGAGVVEFGTQQYRAGSGFCKPVNAQGEGLLPTCSFILTARLHKGETVRGTRCDLGGVKGGFSLQSVDGRKVDTNPFGLVLRNKNSAMTLKARN